jgi:hypothetical protein
MTSTARTLGKAPLYKALNAIAKQKYPLDPTVIASQRALCSCAQVFGVLDERTPVLQRAERAAQVIRDALSQFKESDSRLFARIIFGLDDFEGKSSTARLAHAKKTIDAFSASRYWKARPDVVAAVMYHLESEVKTEGGFNPPTQPPVVRPSTEEDLLMEAAEHAASLHYAAMAALFAHELDKELVASRRFDPRWGDSHLRCARDIFDAYITFVYGHQYVPPDEHLVLADRLPGRYVSQDTADALIFLSTGCAIYGPLSPRQVEEPEYMHLFAYAGIRWLGVPTGPDQIVDSIYREKWWPWFGEQLFVDDNRDNFTNLEAITACSGAFAARLSESLSGDRSPWDSARLLAHRSLAREYEVNEWHPFMDGPPLRNRADAFFDRNTRGFIDFGNNLHHTLVEVAKQLQNE